MSKTYLISLTPTGKFFFGGDMTFSVNDEESSFTSYIISSNLYPQQTSLLGMLRFLILRNNESIFDTDKQEIWADKKDNAKKLIGPKSFQASGQLNDFGVIKKIYPCHIQIHTTNDHWENMEYMSVADQLGMSLPETDITSPTAIINGKSIIIPNQEFDHKKSYSPYFIFNGKHYDETYQCEGNPYVFKKEVCNGINRNISTGEVVENSLFKQEFYRLNEGMRFAFVADIELDNVILYNGSIVQLGADNSQFVIGIEEYTPSQDHDNEGKVVKLTSPSFITLEDINDVRYAITNTIPFKCIRTTTDNVKPYNKRNQRYGYSPKTYLYDKGCLFFFQSSNDAKCFAEAIRGHSDFAQIGYNSCKII